MAAGWDFYLVHPPSPAADVRQTCQQKQGQLMSCPCFCFNGACHFKTTRKFGEDRMKVGLYLSPERNSDTTL